MPKVNKKIKKDFTVSCPCWAVMSVHDHMTSSSCRRSKRCLAAFEEAKKPKEKPSPKCNLCIGCGEFWGCLKEPWCSTAWRDWTRAYRREDREDKLQYDQVWATKLDKAGRDARHAELNKVKNAKRALERAKASFEMDTIKLKWYTEQGGKYKYKAELYAGYVDAKRLEIPKLELELVQVLEDYVDIVPESSSDEELEEEPPLIEGPWLVASSEAPEEWPGDQATQMVIDAIINFSARNQTDEGMTFCIDYDRPPGAITLCSQMGINSPYNRQVDCYFEDVKWDYILWYFGPDREQRRVIHRMRPRDGHFFVVSE